MSSTKTGKGYKITWFIDEFKKKVEEDQRKFLIGIAIQYETIIQRAMREQKHGVVYKVGGKNHTASKPGEAPGIWSGRLTQGIVHVITKNAQGQLVVRVGPSVAAYPAYLEAGTKHMAARPVWGPALKQIRLR